MSTEGIGGGPRRAGIGFIGKSTMNIVPGAGTYLLLGELLLDVALPPDAPATGDCGACQYLWACGGCRARAYYSTGSYMAAEPKCLFTPGANTHAD